MSEVEMQAENTECPDVVIAPKESRVRHAEENNDAEEAVPSKVAKLDENNDSDEEEEEDVYEDEEGEMEEEIVTAADDAVDDAILDESGDSSIEDDEVQSEVEAAVNGMKECQVVIDELTQNANDEILKVEQKYNKLRKPEYSKRNNFIKKIDGFWADVFSHHPELKGVLRKDDIKCFKFLKTIELDDLEPPKTGFSIKFNFSPNPYFTNSSITKEYVLPWNDSPSCQCTSIDWKPSMDLTRFTNNSFFSWFCSQDDASTDDIAEIIKDELWTNPLVYYSTNRKSGSDSELSDDEDAHEAAVYVSDEDEDANYISSEGEEDEDDDDEEEEWETKPSGGKHGKVGNVPNNTEEAYVIDDDEEFLDEDEEEDEEEVDEDEEGLPASTVARGGKSASQDPSDNDFGEQLAGDDDDDELDDLDDEDDEILDEEYDETAAPMKNHHSAEDEDDDDDVDELLEDGNTPSTTTTPNLNGSIDASASEGSSEPKR